MRQPAMARDSDPPPDRPPPQNRTAPIDRRRPGRRVCVSQGLVPVLRSPHRADPEAEEPPEPPEEWDVPRPVAGRR